MAQKASNTLKSKLQYIKINHKNKIEELVEAEYYNELMNLANCLQSGEHDLGGEINKFFQYILPENKEGDVLKVSMAISSKSKKNKKYATQCINEIMNMKERNNLTLTKDLSEKLSAVLKEIYRKIKKHSNLKSFDELLSKAKECLRGGNIIKKYQVEKKKNIALNTSNLAKKGTIIPNVETLVDKNTFNSAKILCKTFKEEKHIEFQFKEFKEDKKEILPAMMRLLIRKFTTVSKIKLTLNNNNVNEEFKIEPKDIQNNILVLFNLDWLFQNLLELEVDLSNENLLKEQIDIQSYNLEIFSELLNKDIKLSLYHSGVYKNRIFNPYQLSNFYSSSPQLKEEDYLYIQQASNNNNYLRIYSNFGKDTEIKSQAMIQFIENKKHLLEMIIIYGYFISKMKLIRMCDFILPMNLEEEIILMLKMNKIILPDFHFLSFFTGNQIVHFTINFNSLDNQSFEKVLSFVSQNTYMNICRINFFQSEEYFKTELLYKLVQNCNSNYKELYNFNYSDNNYYIYDFKINEDLDNYLLRKLSDNFQKNLTSFFYLLTIRTNINELSLIFDMPTILLRSDIYNIIIMKFLLNLLIYIDSAKNNFNTLSVQAEYFIFDSRRHTILNNFFDKLCLSSSPDNKITRLTYQVTFYKIINIHKLVPYNVENLSLGSFDFVTFKNFVNYIASNDFFAHSSLSKLQINLNNSVVNFEECKPYLIRMLTYYPKDMKEINIYTYFIISYDKLKCLLLKTNYNTLENIFLKFDKKSLEDKGYKEKYENNGFKSGEFVDRDFLTLFCVNRKKKVTNKIANIMTNLSLKSNRQFLNYNIFSNIERFIVGNNKKTTIVQFK